MTEIKYILFISIFFIVSSTVQLSSTFFIRSKNEKMSYIHKLIRVSSLRYFLHQTVACAISTLLATGIMKLILRQVSFFTIAGTALCLVNMLFSIISSTTFNIKTAIFADKKNITNAFGAAFKSGILTTLFGCSTITTSITLMSIFGYKAEYKDFVIGYALSSFVIRIMGGVFTKSADIGTDLVGKIESNIPEDDHRNPGVIADSTGDNIGDGGMSTTVLTVYALALTLFQSLGSGFIMPLSFARIFIIGLSTTYFVGSLFTKLIPDIIIASIPVLCTNIIYSAHYATIMPMILMSFAIYKFTEKITSIESKFSKFVPVTSIFFAIQTIIIKGSLITQSISSGAQHISIYISLAIFLIAVKVVELFTSASYSPVQSAIKSASFGAGPTIISGLKISYINVGIIMIITFILLSIKGFLGISGTLNYMFFDPAIITCPIIAMLPAIMSQDLFGAVADNAGGLVEMSNCDSEARKITDELDVVGNMVKAITKVVVFFGGIGCIAIIMLKLINVNAVIDSTQISRFIIVAAISTASSYFLSASLTQGVQSGSMQVALNIRYQFEVDSKILSGESSPDYTQTIDVTSKASRKAAIIPLILLFGSLVISYFLIESKYIHPLSIIIGEFIGIFISLCISLEHSLAGAIYDNMKKGREIVGINKKSSAYEALVHADLVGDLLKDVTGPVHFSFAMIKFLLTAALYSLYMI